MSAQISATVSATNKRTAASLLDVTGILLMMAGEGYINGNFMQPTTTTGGIIIDIVHFVPLALLAWLGAGLLRPTDEHSDTDPRHRGMRIGVTILAVLLAITCIVMIVLGAVAPSLGVGVQAFSDWLAVILGGGGAVVWFVSLFAGRRAA
jgi:hypothetical protein